MTWPAIFGGVKRLDYEDGRMALRYCEPINFEDTCNISGVDALAVAHCSQDEHGGIVLVSQQIVRKAFAFIDFKFGTVPEGDGAFIWTGDEEQAPHGGVRLTDEDAPSDRNRFFGLMKFYERKLCS